MKYVITRTSIAVIIASTVLWNGLTAARAHAQSESKTVVTTQTQSDNDDPPAIPATPAVPAASAVPAVAAEITIQTVEPDGKGKRGKVVAWLGLAVEEASEALSSQLGLKPGEGLTVTLLATDSPAAKADFRKNDVLVELDGQMLVDPHQFRKLVQMHAEGDTVKITFYRGGKKQTASVKLAKTNLEAANDMESMPMMGDFQMHFNDLQRMKGDLQGMNESLSRAGLDKAKVNLELKRTMDQTRKALKDAVRNAASIDRKSLTSADRALATADRELEALARDGVDVDKDATVTIRNKRNSSRTMVTTDDNGSYIIVAGAKTHLTAHDKHGKLLFEGDIDTPAEQDKVPKEVWEKAKPMLDQIVAPSGNEPKEEDKSGDKPNS